LIAYDIQDNKLFKTVEPVKPAEVILAMPQFLVKRSDIQGGAAQITGSDARHITTVLRLGVGDWLRLTDGEGGLYRAVIVSASSKRVEAEVRPLSAAATKAGPRIVLAQALTKHDKFERVIQKSVELGCSEVVPFVSERVVPTFSSAAPKLPRFRKIAIEAAKQCGTALLPKVSEVRSFTDLAETFGSYRRAVFFWEGADKNFLKDVEFTGGDILLVIGPEGGFSEKEAALAEKKGALSASLGPLILRVETAAVTALALVQYRLGYFDRAL